MVEARLDKEFVRICSNLQHKKIQVEPDSFMPSIVIRTSDLRDCIGKDLRKVDMDVGAIFPGGFMAAGREPQQASVTAVEQVVDAMNQAMRNSVPLCCRMFVRSFKDAKECLRNKVREITRPQHEDIERHLEEARLQEDKAQQRFVMLEATRAKLKGEA
jgi:hypothetical protein